MESNCAGFRYFRVDDCTQQHLAVIDPESIHSSKTGLTITLLLNLTDDKLKCNLWEINIFCHLVKNI
jgi:hypothetical protein